MKNPKFLLVSSLGVSLSLIATLAISNQTISSYHPFRHPLTPDDPYFSAQWNFKEINLLEAWQFGQGEEITVAVIDTGVQFGKDLNPSKFVPGWDYIRGNSIERAEDSKDPNGHGTQIAGIIAQTTNNQYGTAGIAYKAHIMPLRVLDRYGHGDALDIALAIRYAVDHGADVINLSLGEENEGEFIKNKTELQKAINYAHQNNVVIVSAAGNKAQESTPLAFANDKVLGVGAYDQTIWKTTYSNYGKGVDIMAPGGEKLTEKCKTSALDSPPFDFESSILATVTTVTTQSKNTQVVKVKDQLYICSGTSQAAAHVTGSVALVQSIVRQKNLKSPTTMMKIIMDSTRSLTNTTKTGKKPSIPYLEVGNAATLANSLITPTSSKGTLVQQQNFAQYLISNAKKFILDERFDEAFVIYDDALKIDSSLTKLVGSESIKIGKNFAEKGKIEQTITLYGYAQRLEPNYQVSASSWNTLCRQGSLYNHPKDVMYACENAIETVSKKGCPYSRTRELAKYRDSRGLARVLTGDYSGAIEDFEAFINSYDNVSNKRESVAKRKRWIQALRTGQNPLTKEEIDLLRKKK